MPVRDLSAYIDDALFSLTRQFRDPKDLEVVLVDDGSADDTVEIAESYQNRLANLQIMRNAESVGAATARNQGLTEIHGRFVMFMDGDDWLVPGHLERVADALAAAGCPMARHDLVRVEGTKRQVVRAPQAVRNQVLDPRASIMPADRQTMVDHPFPPAGMFDRALHEDGLLSFSDGLQTATDRPWVWRLHLAVPSYTVVNESGYCYRRGVATSLTQIYDERRLDFVRAFAEVREMLADDSDGARFLPKLVRTVLAITAYHMTFAEHMSESLYDGLVRRSSELLATFDPTVVREQVVNSSPERHQLLIDVLRTDALAPALRGSGVSLTEATTGSSS